MIGSEILGVAIGLAFVFLLLALLASGLGEWVSRILTLRAQTWRQGFRALIVGHGTHQAAAYEYMNSFFQEPAIKSLSRKPMFVNSEEFGLRYFFWRQPGPSAVPASRVVDALLAPGLRKDDEKGKLSDVDAEKRLDELVKRMTVKTPHDLKNQIRQIAEAVKLEVPAAEHERRFTMFRKRLETWYDESMDRVSGWYKRKLQIVLFVIGIGLAAGLNVSTFTVASAIWNDETKRELVVAEAEKKLEDGADPGLDVLDDLGLPIGWAQSDEIDPVPDNANSWVGHIVGWLITAGAISLGAPFWFDLVGKLVNLRSGGKQTAGEEEKKTPEPEPPVTASASAPSAEAVAAAAAAAATAAVVASQTASNESPGSTPTAADRPTDPV